MINHHSLWQSARPRVSNIWPVGHIQPAKVPHPPTHLNQSQHNFIFNAIILTKLPCSGPRDSILCSLWSLREKRLGTTVLGSGRQMWETPEASLTPRHHWPLWQPSGLVRYDHVQHAAGLSTPDNISTLLSHTTPLTAYMPPFLVTRCSCIKGFRQQTLIEAIVTSPLRLPHDTMLILFDLYLLLCIVHWSGRSKTFMLSFMLSKQIQFIKMSHNIPLFSYIFYLYYSF